MSMLPREALARVGACMCRQLTSCSHTLFVTLFLLRICSYHATKSATLCNLRVMVSLRKTEMISRCLFDTSSREFVQIYVFLNASSK
jgi:hypothetical protein